MVSAPSFQTSSTAVACSGGSADNRLSNATIAWGVVAPRIHSLIVRWLVLATMASSS